MSLPPAGRHSTFMDELARSLVKRIQTFIIVLAALNTPIFILGLIDISRSQSPVTLTLAVVAYIYYGIYYALLRAGYGVPATYSCIMLLAGLIGVGSHNGGGFMMSSVSLFVLLVVGIGMVLRDSRALTFTFCVCSLAYGVLIVYNLGVERPLAFPEIYENLRFVPVLAQTITFLVALAGTWILILMTVMALVRSSTAQEQARSEAERRAQENAELVVQLQKTNESLMETQTRLHETVEALAIPLLPLSEQVLVLPLVGYLDAARAARLTSELLHGIDQYRARVVVLDITGLRDVDERVATALMEAAQSARLLGAEVILSGMSAAAAQALVDLDVDLSNLQTTASLSGALQTLSVQLYRP